MNTEAIDELIQYLDTEIKMDHKYDLDRTEIDLIIDALTFYKEMQVI